MYTEDAERMVTVGTNCKHYNDRHHYKCRAYKEKPQTVTTSEQVTTDSGLGEPDKIDREAVSFLKKKASEITDNGNTTDTHEIDYSDFQPLPEQGNSCVTCLGNTDSGKLFPDICERCKDYSEWQPKQPEQESREEWHKSTVSRNMHGHIDPEWLIDPINNNAEGISILFDKIKELEKENETLKVYIDGLVSYREKVEIRVQELERKAK